MLNKSFPVFNGSVNQQNIMVFFLSKFLSKLLVCPSRYVIEVHISNINVVATGTLLVHIFDALPQTDVPFGIGWTGVTHIDPHFLFSRCKKTATYYISFYCIYQLRQDDAKLSSP